MEGCSALIIKHSTVSLVFQINELHAIGGDDVYSITKMLMEHVVSDEVASQYSWSGQKGKNKLKKTEAEKSTVR